MSNPDFINITAAELENYMTHHNEAAYTLVDVRQKEEYDHSHIPGAVLVPLGPLLAEKTVLPKNGDIIFTCHSGARSRAAALFAADITLDNQTVYNLTGGISGWYGKTLPGLPKVEFLGDLDDFNTVILSAMNLEKGAWKYYTTIIETFPEEPFKTVIEKLSLAESAHAKALYRIMEKEQNIPPLPPFNDLFEEMDGHILEGGLPLSEAISYLKSIEENRSSHILDFSMNIEFSAFDLYKNAARIANNTDIKKILDGIANGEKKHMEQLANAFSLLE